MRRPVLAIAFVVAACGPAFGQPGPNSLDGNEIKDPTHAHPSWPTRGVIDDRLPEP